MQLSPSFRDGPKDQTSDAQLRIGESRCNQPRFRVRRSATPRNDGDYSESGAVAASSQSLVASSTCGRTSWRTRA
jgi:hypothetical protein